MASYTNWRDYVPINQVIPLHKVVELMEKGIRTSFECDISYYSSGVMIFSFNHEKESVLQLRIQDGTYDIILYPHIHNGNILAIARAFKRAHACMVALQVSPKDQTVNTESAKT